MQKDPRRKILWAFAILGLLCPFSCCGIGYFFYRSSILGPAQDLPHQLEMARKEGLPLEPNELRPNPPIPGDQNAATIYKAFFPHIERVFKAHHDLSSACSHVLKDTATAKEEQLVESALDDSRESSRKLRPLPRGRTATFITNMRRVSRFCFPSSPRRGMPPASSPSRP